MKISDKSLALSKKLASYSQETISIFFEILTSLGEKKEDTMPIITALDKTSSEEEFLNKIKELSNS